MRHLLNTKRHQIPNFKIPLEFEILCQKLLTCYAFEVTTRYLKFVQNNELEYYIESVSRFLIDPGPHFGIMLTGNCGTGKTTMLYAIRQLIYHLDSIGVFKKAGFENLDFGFPIITAKTLALELVRTPDKYRDKYILVIDDVGNEPTEILSYKMIYTPLIDMIENRYQRRQYTMISTNLKPKDFREKYGSRIADRFNEMMDVLEFDNYSYRVNSKAVEI